MIKKIAFSSPWGIDSGALLKGMLKHTPNNDGVWEDLVGTPNIYDADWIVASEDLDPRLDMSRIDPNKVILCGREPPWIANPNWDRHSTPYKFKHTMGNSYLLGGWSFPISYRDMEELQRKPRNKKVCVITSNKRICPGHHQRLEFVKKFCRQYPGVLDIYGSGMYAEGLGSHYKGVSTFGDAKKLEWLLQYDYALCLENGRLNGYFSEKLTDAFMAHTVPIYWGAPDVHKYFPDASFYSLDIVDPAAIRKLKEILSNPVSSRVADAVSESRQRIMTKYNWWPTIKRIIDTGRVLS